MKVLENTIKKIVGILRVGFGYAGMLVVARHLHESGHGTANMVSLNILYGRLVALR